MYVRPGTLTAFSTFGSGLGSTAAASGLGFGIAVACHATACHHPFRLTNVPVFRNSLTSVDPSFFVVLPTSLNATTAVLP